MNLVLKIENLVKNFGAKQVLKDINLELKRGEILSILGRSGCGKSTLLRIIAGLETPSSGSIKTDEKISLMFQNYALMPHLSVFDNIALALHFMPKAQRFERTKNLLKRFFIDEIAGQKPDEISGGQAQRVAFARALANEAAIVLLDEPFSNLDTNLKTSLRNELKNLIKQSNISAILVTHDKDDAFVMSDRIALIDEGEIIALDTPRNLYLHPANALVASFLGEVNDLSALKQAYTELEAKLKPTLGAEFSEFYYELYKRNFIFRPEDVFLGGKFKAKVVQKQYLGAYMRLKLNYFGFEFMANIYEAAQLQDEINFGLKPLSF